MPAAASRVSNSQQGALDSPSEETDHLDIRWRAPIYCSASTCIEVAAVGTSGDIAIRDSKLADSPILTYTRQEFMAFISSAKSGYYDDLC